MNPSDVKALILRAIPEAKIDVLSSDNVHFEVVVTSRLFENKSLLERERIVNQALRDPLSDGRLHAVRIKTLIPK